MELELNVNHPFQIYYSDGSIVTISNLEPGTYNLSANYLQGHFGTGSTVGFDGSFSPGTITIKSGQTSYTTLTATKRDR